MHAGRTCGARTEGTSEEVMSTQPAPKIIKIIRMREALEPYEVCQSSCGVGSSVVTHVMRRYEELGIPASDLSVMEPKQVEELFYPLNKRRRKDVPLPDFQTMYERLQENGSKLNVYMLWLEYIEENPDGYGYTQYNKYFREYVAKTYGPKKLKMLVTRKPGEKMYLDWMGDQPMILLNPETGELEKAHIFCATLGVSSVGYAEVFADETTENYITGIIHSLNYFGMAPKYFVPDNLRVAVTKNSRDEVIITRICEDLEKWYDVIFLPTPPRKPTAKGSVERYVGFTESHFVEPLKKKTYVSVEECNLEGFSIMDNLNKRIERGRKKSKWELFEQIDRPEMHALPDRPFTLWEYKPIARVPDTYHVTYDQHQYSVPFTMAGKPAIVKASAMEIQICDEYNRLVTAHKRMYAEYPKAHTCKEHMPPAHLYYTDVNEMDGSKYRNWAASIGPAASKVIETILASATHEEQMYDACTSIMYHAKEIAPQIVEKAAKTCIDLGMCKCTAFKKMITEEANNNKHAKQTQVILEDHNPNVRGKDFWK